MKIIKQIMQIILRNKHEFNKKHKEQTKELTDNICKKSKKVTIF